MLRYAVFLVLAFVFQGCEVYKSAVQSDLTRERYMQATRKGEILSELQTEAVILATYLNEAYPEHFDSKVGTYFFVDIYISNDSLDMQKRGLFNPLYTINLFGTVMPLSIRQLSHDEVIAHRLDYRSPWGEYFLVTFPPQPRKKVLELIINRKGLDKSVLTFSPSSSSTILNRL